MSVVTTMTSLRPSSVSFLGTTNPSTGSPMATVSSSDTSTSMAANGSTIAAVSTGTAVSSVSSGGSSVSTGNGSSPASVTSGLMANSGMTNSGMTTVSTGTSVASVATITSGTSPSTSGSAVCLMSRLGLCTGMPSVSTSDSVTFVVVVAFLFSVAWVLDHLKFGWTGLYLDTVRASVDDELWGLLVHCELLVLGIGTREDGS